MDVDRRVPGRRDEDLMVGAVGEGFNTCAMGGEDGLCACFQVDPVKHQLDCRHIASWQETGRICSLPHVPVQPGAIRHYFVLIPANVQHRSPMLKRS